MGIMIHILKFIFGNLDIGIGSSEICQWTFYGNANRKVEVIMSDEIIWVMIIFAFIPTQICCTSIVYATDKKQTKVRRNYKI